MNMKMKNWKRALVFVMTIGMALGLMTVGAFAANGDEAEVAGSSYGTLKEAVQAAQDGAVITLLKDVYLPGLKLDKSLTFDLNGNTLSVAGNQLTWMGSKNVTIQNGSLSGSGTIVQQMSGNLNLEDLFLENGGLTFDLRGGTTTLSNCSFRNNGNSILMISGGANVAVTNGSALTSSSTSNGAILMTSGRLTVENSEITGVGPGVCISSTGHNATVTLNSGAEINTTSGDGPAMRADAGTVEINEGASLGAMGTTPISGNGQVVLPEGKTLEYQNGRYVVGDCAHEYEGPEMTPATCKQEGKKVWTCTKCGVKDIQPIDKLPHTEVIDEAEEATCTTAGWTEGKHCSECEEVLVAREPIPAGHAWSEWTETVPATCTEAGEETRGCTKCDATETQPIEAAGHTEVTDFAEEATCIAEGKTEGKHCSVCNEVLVAQKPVPVKEHTPGTAWSSDTANHWHECTVCHTHLEEAVHTENGGVVTTEPTSTTSGTRTYSCTECGRVLRTETIPATGGGTTGGSTGGSTGGGPTGGGSINGGSEDLPENDTPLAGAPEDEEDLGESDVPLGNKPFLFEDVGEKRWFYPAIKYVFDRGLMDGRSDTRFDPMANTTRGMVVTVLHRMEETPAPMAQVDTFTDLVAGQWYTDAVLWAADNGIVNGYSTGAFGPQDDVTREQLVAILYRYAQYKGYDTSIRGDLSAFGDQNRVAKYAREAMEWAVGAKLISGVTETSLEPKGNATRAQIATVLMNFDRFVTESTQGE